MILDTSSNAGRYFGLHPNFKVAFDYINSTDLLATEPGTYQVADGVKAIISDKEGINAEAAAAKFECHNKNIDIQLCIRGDEAMLWTPRSACRSPKGDYNEEKDVIFFNDAPQTQFSLKAGEFTIFFPEDVHAAMIGTGLIKKLVVKVKI